MKKFREYISENTLSFAETEKGFVGVDNEAVRDNINMILTRALAMPFATPYHAMEIVRKILASYHIFIPKTNFLEGNAGHEVYMINQFGEKYGYDSNSDIVVKNSSPYHVYFEYAMNDRGKFDVFSEVVTEVELEEILSDVEEEGGDDRIVPRTGAEYTFDTYRADNEEEAEDEDDEDHEDSEDEEFEDELEKGEDEEADEHDLSPQDARKTALDHLKKHPNYYSKLEKLGLAEQIIRRIKTKGD